MKTFLKIYISLSLILSPILFINSAKAATLGGWTIGGLVSDGASSIANGTKQVIIDGKDYIKKGTAKITPTASQVSKVLARGVAGYALSVAVEQLIGAVDWVLDPANNRITYYETDPNEINDPTKIQGYKITGALVGNPYKSVIFTNKTTLGNRICEGNQGLQGSGGGTWTFKEFKVISGIEYVVCNPHGTQYSIETVINPNYDPEAEKEQKTLPLDVVSAQVISNAASGDTNAQVATTAAAQDIINDAQQDEAKARPIVQQLEASASTENADSAAQEAANDATGTSQPNTSNPDATDLKLSFPVFCGWAPVVCEAAQVAISFPTTAQTWVTDLLGVGQRIETEQKATTAEAAKTATATQAINHELTNSNDLPQKDTSTVVLPDVPPVPQTVQVNWGNACPAPTTATLSMFGQSTEITLINYDAICEWAWVVEYSVIALASISSVFIVAGRKS